MKPSPPYTVHVHTFGCRLNQYESDGILQSLLEDDAFILASEAKSADFIIVNTCTVTDRADRRVLGWLRRLCLDAPQAQFVVTGCMAQTDAELFEKLPNIFLVIGNNQKTQVRELIWHRLRSQDNSIFSPLSASTSASTSATSAASATSASANANPFASVFDYSKNSPVLPQGRTRAYLKIQDGCHKQCSYCKIPQARGRAQSRPMQDILRDIHQLEEKGVPEIVITGVNVGWYRDPATRHRLPHLLETILEKLSHARLRLSSIEPCDVDEALALVLQHPRFCPFLHVPLQSGSPRILRGMQRSYSVDSFQKRIAVIRRYHPDIFLGTDVIAGFPSESERDFSQTLHVCRDIGFANIHAFPFSPRRGTLASFYGPKVDRATMRLRMHELRDLRRTLWESYVRKARGQTREMIIEKVEHLADATLESHKDDGYKDMNLRRMIGLSEDFLRISLNSQAVPFSSNIDPDSSSSIHCDSSSSIHCDSSSPSLTKFQSGSKVQICIGDADEHEFLIQGTMC